MDFFSRALAGTSHLYDLFFRPVTDGDKIDDPLLGQESVCRFRQQMFLVEDGNRCLRLGVFRRLPASGLLDLLYRRRGTLAHGGSIGDGEAVPQCVHDIGVSGDDLLVRHLGSDGLGSISVRSLGGLTGLKPLVDAPPFNLRAGAHDRNKQGPERIRLSVLEGIDAEVQDADVDGGAGEFVKGVYDDFKAPAEAGYLRDQEGVDSVVAAEGDTFRQYRTVLLGA